MTLEEFQTSAKALLANFTEQARVKGVVLDGSPTAGQLADALAARASYYSPGARVAAQLPQMNEFDVLLESFSAQTLAKMLAFGAASLPQPEFDKVPGAPVRG